MATHYIIRTGWNAANQSSNGTARNPKNDFESNRYKLVAVVEADSEDEACKQFTGTVYNGQSVFATSKLRSVKGLTKEASEFFSPVEA